MTTAAIKIKKSKNQVNVTIVDERTAKQYLTSSPSTMAQKEFSRMMNILFFETQPWAYTQKDFPRNFKGRGYLKVERAAKGQVFEVYCIKDRETQMRKNELIATVTFTY